MGGDPRARWWRREGHRRGRFRYFDADGRRITDAAALARLDALRLPPAWTDVRIAPSPKAELQAVGHDQKGRPQYVYHPDWTARRSAAKYAKLVAFAEALPRFRTATAAHLAEAGPTRHRVLALLTRLLDAACFRIGDERYCKANGSFGVATLENRHLRVGASSLAFAFRGKHGIQHKKIVADPALAALAREVRALPGRRLFQYRREDGAVAPLRGRDVNAYIKEVMGPGFSAKDFRTWGATLRAARWLDRQGPAASKTAATKAIRRCVAEVARHLGNTPAICRASYVSPRVLAAFEADRTLRDFRPADADRERLFAAGYTAEEMALVALLQAPDPPAPGLRVSLLRAAGASATDPVS